MSIKMNTAGKDNKTWLYRAVCVMAVIAASLPLACNYIMTGGNVTEWIARVNELAAGFRNREFYFFPGMETLAETGIWNNAVNSNFWLMLPGLFVRMTGNVAAAYRFYMLLLQIGTFMASALFFREIFADEDRIPVFFGTLLYMTCPYRIFICYDLADLVQAAAWMLLPLYAWAAVSVFSGKGNPKRILCMGVVLAGVGYADTIFFITCFGITLLISVLTKNLRGIAGLALGGILGFPGLYRLGVYVLGKGFFELDVMLQSIMPKGYHFGQFFSSYYWRDNHPGMGLGMLMSLLTVLWVRFVRTEAEPDREEWNGKCRVFTGLSAFFAVLSLACFPWDFVQRAGNWSLRIVSFINTPAVFWGMAYFGLCVPAAWGINRLKKSDHKVLSFVVPLIILLACVWVCIYQCNMLTYARPPMMFE